METKLTKDLIPTNGVHITEAFYPAGFQVAEYDAKGFATAPRWFPTMEKAAAHAATLK